MKLPRVFSTPKHQRYEYKPRFYDAKKEDLEKRLKEIHERKEGGSIEKSKARISQGFKNRGSNFAASSEYRSKQVFRSNMLLLGIIIALIGVTYILLNIYLPEILESLN